ncbi:MAG: DUF4386 family protein [Actinomycetota bacterium]|nr:DUF4386 family protein [Actinomycetota bacterium]
MPNADVGYSRRDDHCDDAAWRSVGVGRQGRRAGENPLIETRLLAIGGALALAGLVLAVIAGAFHAAPPGHDPNDHAATFPGIAASQNWAVVHFVQFAAYAVALSGLLALYRVVEHRTGRSVLTQIGVATTITTAAAVAFQHAIDGIALKQAIDAWAGAPSADKASAWRDAELIRWVEWSGASYASLLQGLSVILLGVAMARSRILPLWIAGLLAIAGIGSATSGVIIGLEGFSHNVVVVETYAGLALPLAIVAILFTSWRRSRSAPRRGAPAARYDGLHGA